MPFKATILVVDDVLKSRTLYEDLLGCKVEADFGVSNVGFEGGFALYQKALFAELIGQKEIASRAHNLSVYFEYVDIVAVRDKVAANGFELVHDMREQPWGQRVFRFYDYDHHIVEIGEDMDQVLLNMQQAGMSQSAIAKKTGYSQEEVTRMLNHVAEAD
jgi:catechol 2,3-dioxygenase-like lactoylglutathione lyase family enzyme